MGKFTYREMLISLSIKHLSPTEHRLLSAANCQDAVIKQSIVSTNQKKRICKSIK